MPLRSIVVAAILLGSTAANSVAEPIMTESRPGPSYLRNGPGPTYGVVARIPGGSSVEVIGCLPPAIWCETIVGDLRGWVESSRLYLAIGWPVPGPVPYGPELRGFATYGASPRYSPLVPLTDTYGATTYRSGPVYK
jgi:hypothetical protein